MTEADQQELGRTLWAIANDLWGTMNADDFRDYMLSFLFLRYLSDNYEAAVKKELGTDYPQRATGKDKTIKDEFEKLEGLISAGHIDQAREKIHHLQAQIEGRPVDLEIAEQRLRRRERASSK